MNASHVLADVTKHTVLLEDSVDQDWDGELSDELDDGKPRLGLGPGVIGLRLDRSSGVVPLHLARVDEEPNLALDEWSHVAVGGVEVEGDRLILGQIDFGQSDVSFACPPGRYGVLYAIGGLDSSAWDVSYGAEHLWVWLWPTKSKPSVSVRRTHPSSQDPRFKPLRDEESCAKMLSSPHGRLDAIAELLRHGTPDALALLGDAMSDRTARHTAASALFLADPLPFDWVERLVADPEPAVRRRALGSLITAVLFWQFEVRETLDFDRLGVIASGRCSDDNAGVARYAEELLGQVQKMT